MRGEKELGMVSRCSCATSEVGHELAMNAMIPTLSSFRDFFQFLGLSSSSLERSMI